MLHIQKQASSVEHGRQFGCACMQVLAYSWTAAVPAYYYAVMSGNLSMHPAPILKVACRQHAMFEPECAFACLAESTGSFVGGTAALGARLACCWQLG